MVEISSDIIYSTVKKLVLEANISLPKEDYLNLVKLYENETNINAKNALKQILQNAKIAFDEKRPLCQDTGFVTSFLKIGQNVKIVGDNINFIINKAIADAYKEYFLRKSIVSDPLFERKNTYDNTPALIHTEITEGNEIEIILNIKGGGCENVSAFKMLTPSQGIEGVKNFVIETVKNAGSKPCPPIKIGIGIGSNFEGSAILSKKALLEQTNNDNKYQNLEKEILQEINNLNIGVMGLGGNSTCFGVNILHKPCHIASLPVAISISCHSSRSAKATIKENDIIYFENNKEFLNITTKNNDVLKIITSEIEKIKNLKAGMNIELSGTIYTARDAAHKKFEELLLNNKKLPFEIKNSIIFYAGPCPNNKNEIIGPIGPTTSTRMDKYTPSLYKQGLLATIGKGERTENVKNAIKQYNGKYFTITGGVASLLKSHVISAELIAYPELGAEAVYKLEVKNLPLLVKY